jgi:nucleotide-binding universal stress UspA family protein
MTMKNVLLLVHDDVGQEARYQVALDLTRALQGHLLCLDVTYVPPLVGTGYYDDGYVMADLLTAESKRESANRNRLEERLAQEDVSWEWKDVSGDPATVLRHAASFCDLIVTSRQLDDTSLIDMRRTAAELIVRSHKPVVAVPPACQRLGRDHALIAWDGSPAALAALRAAIPLLRLTGNVTMLQIDECSSGASVEDAAAYLSRHDIHVSIDQIARGHAATSDVLIAQVKARQVDYVVMGGFGHARLVEAVLGGVSRQMLTESPVPVFFAH